jgi:hypothetical protein
MGVGSVCPAHTTSTFPPCVCADPYLPDASGTSCVDNCPANMSGSPCACDTGYVLNSDGLGCVQEKFTLKVLQDPRPEVEPGSSREVVVRVENAKQAPQSGVRVKLEVDVDETSGGHAHGGADRDKGSLSGSASCDPPVKNCATEITDFDGNANFTFKAPVVSGEHTVTAACISPACDNTDSGKIYVKVPELHEIPADPALYVLIGGEANKKHHDNHYLTSSALDQLFVLVINYHVRYPNEPVLHLNDASLVWGGQFDIDGDWDTPHVGHQRGVAIDIRANEADGNIPASLFDSFRDLVSTTKTILSGRVISAVAKMHCSAGRDPAKDNCNGDNNRHFHVNLLGVDQ